VAEVVGRQERRAFQLPGAAWLSGRKEHSLFGNLSRASLRLSWVGGNGLEGRGFGWAPLQGSVGVGGGKAGRLKSLARAGGVAQVEALSSNSSTTKKKKKKPGRLEHLGRGGGGARRGEVQVEHGYRTVAACDTLGLAHLKVRRVQREKRGTGPLSISRAGLANWGSLRGCFPLPLARQTLGSSQGCSTNLSVWGPRSLKLGPPAGHQTALKPQ
jgi:hypothetical protein